MPGFEAKFKHPLLKRHECPICLFAMRHPVQTECGHLFCRDCLKPVLKRRHPVCPLDKEEITQEGTFPDNACRREILKLQVFCNFQNCPWIGALKDLEAHLGNCDYRDVQCTQCGQYIQQLDMEAHQKELCAMRPTTCPHCSKDIPTQHLQTHFDKLCTKITRGCPNECDPSLKMNLQELEKHTDLKKGTCPLSEVPCPYGQYGCSFISLRQNITPHLDQYRVYHFQIQAESFDEFRQVMTKLSLSFEHILERVGSLETRSNALERLQDALEQRIEFLDDRRDRHADFKIEHLEEQTTQIATLVTTVDKRLTEIEVKGVTGTGLTSGYNTGSTAFGTEVPAITNYQVFGDTNVPPQRVEALHTGDNGVPPWEIDEFERRRRESVTSSLYSTPSERRDRHADQNEIKIERLEKQTTPTMDKRFSEIEVKRGTGLGSTVFSNSEVPAITNYQVFGDTNVPPQRVEALHTRVVELEHSVDRALSSCLDQELRIQLLERATYNGVLLWKIDEFELRRREAVDSVTLSLYSTPFYTSRHGYKMCARVYLNGDGMGKGSHLSFFFVIMRGPFDALLQWPFKQKVTLSLINQNGKKHISDSFRPDPHSSSFQKPGRREMNIASGCPMFIRIDHLLNGGFAKDDAIYVRVVVETFA